MRKVLCNQSLDLFRFTLGNVCWVFSRQARRNVVSDLAFTVLVYCWLGRIGISWHTYLHHCVNVEYKWGLSKVRLDVVVLLFHSHSGIQPVAHRMDGWPGVALWEACKQSARPHPALVDLTKPDTILCEEYRPHPEVKPTADDIAFCERRSVSLAGIRTTAVQQAVVSMIAPRVLFPARQT